MRKEWSGDVDLDNGTLQASFAKYQERLQMISRLSPRNLPNTRILIQSLASGFSEDLKFLHIGKTSYCFNLAMQYQFIVNSLGEETLRPEQIEAERAVTLQEAY